MSDQVAGRAPHDRNIALREPEIEQSAQPGMLSMGQPEDCGPGAKAFFLSESLSSRAPLSSAVSEARAPVTEGLYFDGGDLPEVLDH